MNFILGNTFLWEADWRPLIKFHCLITIQGHYWPAAPPPPNLGKHLVVVFEARPLQQGRVYDALTVLWKKKQKTRRFHNSAPKPILRG